MKISWFKVLFIDLPFVLFLLLYVVIAIKFLPATPQPSDLVTDYFAAQLGFLLYPGLLFGLFLGLFVWYTKKVLLQPLLRYAFGLFFIGLITFLFSFAAVYIYAFVQINARILSYNANPSSIITSPQAVSEEIAATDELSLVPISETAYKKDLLLLSMKKKHGFYEERFLPSFPMALFRRSYIPPTTIAFTNNYLAFSELTPSTLSIISPSLGKFLIEHSTEHSITKSLPDTQILEKDSYIAFRKHTIDKQVDQLDAVAQTLDGSIASINDYIATNEASIAKNRETLAKAEEQEKNIKCKKAEKCAAAKEKYARIKTQARDNIAKAEAAMDKNEAVLGASIENKDSVLTAKATTAAREELTDTELGLFTPPNKITMTLKDTDDPRAFDAYVHTLIHEYFHYISYIDEDTKLDHFFEEALTEYFARMAYENYMGKKANFGYEVHVRIIEAMTKKIPERQLLGIYYDKDQKGLEALLNTVYGKDFYTTNAAAFNMLNSLSPQESLVVANLIMKQIGGDQLKLKDTKKQNPFTIPAPNENSPIQQHSTADLP